MSASKASPGAGRERQEAIYRAGVSGLSPAVPTDPDGLELAAKRATGELEWAYLAGGAGAERTMAANRAAFDRWSIVPRVLRDVSTRDLSVNILGKALPAPVLLAPIGVLELAHPDADLAVAKAAAAHGIPFIFSNQASVPMEQTAAVMGTAPRWFQLYWSTEDDLVDSLLHRAEACGAEAVVITLDTTMLGWRPRDLNLGSLPFSKGQGIAQYTSDPVFNRIVSERIAASGATRPDVKITPDAVRTLISVTRHHPGAFFANLTSPKPRAAVETFLQIYSRPSLSWEQIDSVRSRTSLPVLLKGVLHPDDARRAVQAGVDGIVVSNHGGRQVDGAIASLDALVPIAEAVGNELTILLDSGIRTGADVAKALALGADAVLLGRPYVYGLAAAGERGVWEVLANIIGELDLTLGLSGYTSIAELNRESVTAG